MLEYKLTWNLCSKKIKRIRMEIKINTIIKNDNFLLLRKKLNK